MGAASGPVVENLIDNLKVVAHGYLARFSRLYKLRSLKGKKCGKFCAKFMEARRIGLFLSDLNEANQ